MARSASVLAVLALSLTLGACASRPTHQQLGTAAGAVVGGATGSVLFGSTLGTVAGAAAGAVVGNELSRKPRR
ncbi:glycine zipper 2TM domain-containing protein [Curvibacter sp. HBC61]|uniref:Glycine zipper 2TM domain-containing protein n=1 Tax=Curvibacter cyanobacteriorum TaxID=3026422 RepID=A0ABT5MSD1_9BURK|nr:glycine zipper 2TM domain-containing protein [Curvibacter sp. HBC61]MDD0836954.1 glycine zipper 2TM domain-containing protein [Curvibacter sp. HBC61]